MALTYDQVSAITQRKILPKMVDNIFDSNPLLQRAKKKWYMKTDGGTTITVPLNYAQVSASDWYSGADTLSTTDNDVFTAAEYQWKQIYANISITGRDEMINSGDSAKLKFVSQKVKIAEKTIADQLGTALYNAGTAAKNLGGLRLIVGTSNTVGGISQTTYSWWAAQLDSSTTTLSIGAMQTRDNVCTIGNDGPSVIMTTRTLYNSYYGALQPQQRFQDGDSAKGGFSSLMFNGKPVMVDSHVPANYMFFLNEDYLDLAYHPDRDFKFEPFMKPVNQDVQTAKILWMGNLVSSNNRMQGAFSALTA